MPKSDKMRSRMARMKNREKNESESLLGGGSGMLNLKIILKPKHLISRCNRKKNI